MRALISFGLLVCLVVGYVLSEPIRDCLTYRLEAQKYIHINEENGARNMMRINMDVLMRPYKGSQLVWTLDIRNPEIFIDREKNPLSIELNKCPSNAIPATMALLPTLAVYDNDGLLREIRVDKLESKVAINVKLYVASLLQINLNTLREIKNPVHTGRKELLYVGECPVTYELQRSGDKTGENIRITKHWALEKCDDLRRSGKGHKIAGIERPKISAEKEEDTIFGRQITLIRREDVIIPELILFGANLTYKADRLSGNRLGLNAGIKMTLQSRNRCDAPDTPNFINTNAEIITRQVLSPVNEQLLSESGDSKDADLREIYRGLASDRTGTNIYQDLYERALRCWDVMP